MKGKSTHGYRQQLLERARVGEKKGICSKADIHLLNWWMAGDDLLDKTSIRDREFSVRDEGSVAVLDSILWKATNSKETMSKTAEHPIHKYLCELLDNHTTRSYWTPGC